MTHSSIRLRLLGATAILALGLVSAHAQTPAASSMPNAATETKPAKADADMQKVLDTLASLKGKPVESLSPSEARKQPTPTDAVMKIIKDENLKVDPQTGLKVSNSHFADMGKLRLRTYTPDGTTKDSKLPVVVYFRGGGWVIADLDVYDTSPAAIARKAKAIVVSVDYPMAPEHKFPAAHDEAVEAYRYIAKNVESWGGDPAKIAIVGESAGGNLAVNTALAAHTQNLAMPVAVVAVYPVASNNLDTPSEQQYAAAKPLNKPMMAWFFDKVLQSPDQKNDKRLDLISADLKGLPPVTIINAEIDPLKSDGDMLADKMKEAGVNVTHKIYSGVTHEFFGMDAVVAKAQEAQDFAVSQLNLGFNGASTTGNAPAAK